MGESRDKKVEDSPRPRRKFGAIGGGALGSMGFQEVKQPWYERGIEVDPPYQGRTFVRRVIQRAWSTMFGNTGAGVVPLRANKAGLLYTLPYPKSALKYFSGGTQNMVTDGTVIIPWSRPVDYVVFAYEGDALQVLFAVDPAVIVDVAFITKPTGQTWCVLPEGGRWVTHDKMTVTDVGGVGVNVFTYFGFQLVDL